MSSAHTVTVWAPVAERVDVEFTLGDRPAATAPLVRQDGGWWAWELPADVVPADGPTTGVVTAGGDPGMAPYPALDYGFRVDGGDLTPDPRSAHQPHGVHGTSRWFDASQHLWHDATWAGPQQGLGVLGAVVYELHVGTFTKEGTLDAAQARLPHLVELGVDVVELMPLSAWPGRWNWGYDGVGPWAVEDVYGGPAALQRFVDECHRLGLGVCLDVVYNHLGPVGNYLSRFGPYFSDAHPTPWGAGFNLDGPDSEAVRRWMVDNALRWFADFHVDALRLDAVHELRDDSPTHLLAQLADEVAELGRTLGRPLHLVAESDLNNAMMVTPTGAGGRGMDAQWDDDVHHALHVTLTGETQGYYADFAGHSRALPDGGPLAVLAKTLTRGFLHDGTWSSFRGHDWGAEVDREKVDGRRFVAYLQTHDQVGNRAVGERISALVSPSQQAIGAALYLTSAFTPMVFMGEEWAATTPFQFFTDFEEPEMAQAVTEGRRREFESHGWAAHDVPDPQDEATYRRSQLRWDEVRLAPHARMLSWYRDLIALRRKEFALSDGRLDLVEVDFDERGQWLVMRRGSLRTVVNLAGSRWTVPLDAAPTGVVLAWEPGQTKLKEQSVHLPPRTAAIVRVG
ncbi:malto-oligosyltrehalose trehalohydrolase [Phycicoccus sp. Root101]|uniref:malto-oligosyltrehalose trehalohydrolase n=1 Tax=Phycicoccus sp. Root101 TaxID=1736421 RepID=UPI000702FDAA|nr:malto-oligosyltrehalose trehalohydrolase [Phycicoccus sp. Root101]KQU66501.1 malto-oligosyltrehalose trehalohydrolase [Phycicoccus sp. Root101]